jgi:uncharacterized protein
LPRRSLTDATAASSPLSAETDGARLAVRLTPRARANRIDGIAPLADGSAALKASVTAPPEDGRANGALLGLLAKEFGLPARDFRLVTGARSRDKTVEIAGADAALLRQRLSKILGSRAE